MTEIQKVAPSRVEFELKVSPEEWDKALKQAISEARGEVKIKGFRPGHAPDEAVLERVGEERIRQHALAKAFSKPYLAFLKEHDIAAIAPPNLDVKSWEGPVVAVSVGVKPEVDITKLQKVKVKRIEEKVTDKRAQEVLTDLYKRFAEWEETDRPSKIGDRMEISFQGKIDGVPIDGTASKNHPVILGEAQLVKDFEKAIIGLKKGETKSFPVKFPADYHGKSVAGKTVEFDVSVDMVQQSRDLSPEQLSEKMFGEKLDKNGLNKRIKEDLQQGLNNENDNRTRDKVVEELVEKAKLEVPEELVQEELKHIRIEREKWLAARHLSVEQYLSQAKLTPEKYEEQLVEGAEKQVKVRLVFDKLMEENKPELTPEEEQQIAKKVSSAAPEQKAQAEMYERNTALIKKLLNEFIK